MRSPYATGPRPIPRPRKRTATVFLAVPRRRPDHDNPINGDHHGFNDSDPSGGGCKRRDRTGLRQRTA